MNQNNNNKSIIVGAAAIVAILATAGIVFSSYAFEGDQTQMQAERPMMNRFRDLSDEEKEQFEAKKQEMEAKREAVGAALVAGDYNAWLEAVGDDCPYKDKINADNFSQLVEARSLQAQAREIMKNLGIDEKPGFHGKGFGPERMGQDN